MKHSEEAVLLVVKITMKFYKPNSLLKKPHLLRCGPRVVVRRTFRYVSAAHRSAPSEQGLPGRSGVPRPGVAAIWGFLSRLRVFQDPSNLASQIFLLAFLVCAAPPCQASALAPASRVGSLARKFILHGEIVKNIAGRVEGGALILEALDGTALGRAPVRAATPEQLKILKILAAYIQECLLTPEQPLGLEERDFLFAAHWYLRAALNHHHVYILLSNEAGVSSFSSRGFFVISEALLKNPAALLHEAAEGFGKTSKGSLLADPLLRARRVTSVHALMRGAGKNERMEAKRRGRGFRLGLQDKVFGIEENERLTAILTGARRPLDSGAMEIPTAPVVFRRPSSAEILQELTPGQLLFLSRVKEAEQTRVAYDPTDRREVEELLFLDAIGWISWIHEIPLEYVKAALAARARSFLERDPAEELPEVLRQAEAIDRANLRGELRYMDSWRGLVDHQKHQAERRIHLRRRLYELQNQGVVEFVRVKPEDLLEPGMILRDNRSGCLLIYLSLERVDGNSRLRFMVLPPGSDLQSFRATSLFTPGVFEFYLTHFSRMVLKPFIAHPVAPADLAPAPLLDRGA